MRRPAVGPLGTNLVSIHASGQPTVVLMVFRVDDVADVDHDRSSLLAARFKISLGYRGLTHFQVPGLAGSQWEKGTGDRYSASWAPEHDSCFLHCTNSIRRGGASGQLPSNTYC